LQGSFDGALLYSTEYLGYDSQFWFGTSKGNARLSSVNDPQSSKHVTNQIAPPTVIRVQHAAAPPAPQKAGQQSVAPATSFPAAAGAHEVIFAENLLISFELFPADITWMVIPYQNAPFLNGLSVAHGLLRPPVHYCGSGFRLAKCVCARKDGID
jgi:hypothetical protein